MMDPATFRALRRRLNLSQAFVGEYLGMSKVYVCQYERGAKYRPHEVRMRPAYEKMLETWKIWGMPI